MKKIALIFTLLSLLSLLFLIFSSTAAASILPEEDLIGETLIVEQDRTLIEENIQKDHPDRQEEETTVIHMTKTAYLSYCVAPAVGLIFLGVVGFALLSILQNSRATKAQKEKSPSQSA